MNFEVRTFNKHSQVIIGKALIETWILLHLTIGQRGFETRAPLIEVVECIFYRLKTGRGAGAMPMVIITHQAVLWRQRASLEFGFLLLLQVEQGRLLVENSGEFINPKPTAYGLVKH
ncbi:hypothetical protein [Spirosoma aureum]|uniref:hypothetical protein n=1 Tax=Spirosoma aureum TaxID=2692134 RepID=UPI001E60F20F|nr:hypothetical protein [Spirosoma aureum]